MLLGVEHHFPLFGPDANDQPDAEALLVLERDRALQPLRASLDGLMHFRQRSHEPSCPARGQRIRP